MYNVVVFVVVLTLNNCYIKSQHFFCVLILVFFVSKFLDFQCDYVQDIIGITMTMTPISYPIPINPPPNTYVYVMHDDAVHSQMQ